MGETDNPKRHRSQAHRLKRLHSAPDHKPRGVDADAVVDCGWGRLIFGHTFDSAEKLAEVLRAEGPDRRDIAFYVRDPHVLLAMGPQELFLDPSHTYRLDLSTYRVASRRRQGFHIRRLTTRGDAEAVNAIYAQRGMVRVPPEFFWSRRDDRTLTVLVAEDDETGEIQGSVMGIDHTRAFGDTEGGTSLWCLAVSAQAPHAGLGESLVRKLAEHFKTRGASFMDLSVLHDNEQAIALYEKLGFRRVQVFAVKRRNVINERLYAGSAPDEGLNPYAQIVVDEARRRGIHVEVIDAEGGFFRLTHGGRSIRCREALCELTSAVAMSICDDKRATRRIVEGAGVRVPEQLAVDDAEQRAEFLKRHKSVVVKPARGEQGRGVAVDLTTTEEIEAAVEVARQHCHDVIVEECYQGDDLRLIVIDYRVVAAAIRRPARIVGDGRATVRELIEVQSRRREAATQGESSIPLDAETERCLAGAGYGLDDVPDQGVEINVRKTANLHTGGTIHDVTDETHPKLIQAAIAVARAIEIPVTGIDLMVKSAREPDYIFIEANERPGLANHEPQPTAERYVDLMFPLSIPQAVREAQRRRRE
ncbi:N-acetylglutaminylglutamine synthetase [Pararhodobacter sp. SW119]|uniref:N-acetylglutaminylglutamine synthetase n=1 Tax=Pararhodobacter sp. SW119 TaxID=2780075 RepID=UPI001AE07FA3|nr:N-acetylglutaminylglutamine synthetase [Pararhodobacter sp. SW119]